MVDFRDDLKIPLEACGFDSHLSELRQWALEMLTCTPQWGAADAEIKVPSDENTDRKGSLFKA